MVETVLLISGGIDSACIAYEEQPDLGITVDYGQACAEAEVDAASKICDELNLDHSVIDIDCSELGAGSMSQQNQLNVATTPEWWPFRNQLIITMVATEAVKQGASKLLAGSVSNDQEHADGTKEFYEQIDVLLSLQEGNLSISAPAIGQTSTELVNDSGAPLSLLGWTHSCHTSNEPCGRCRGCRKRHRVLTGAFNGQA